MEERESMTKEQPMDRDALLSFIVSQAVELVGGTLGGLYLYLPEQDVLEWSMAVGQNLVPTGTTLCRGDGLSGRVWETGQPLIVDDYRHWEGRVAAWEDYPFAAMVGVPVRWGEEFLGVLNVAVDAPRTFSPADAELLSLFAQQAAIAIENARLYESERSRSMELEVLCQASLHLTAALELEPVLGAILEHVLELVTADDAHIFLYDGQRLAFGAALWADAHQREPYAEPRPQGLTYTVARSGEAVVIPDVNSHPLFQDYQWGGAIASLPLSIGGRVAGVMNIGCGRPHVFEESELRVLGLLADQAAIAIQNARLYEESQRRATELGILYSTATTAMTSVRLDEVLNRTLTALQETLQPDDIAILLVKPETEELVIRAHTGFPGGPELMRRSIGVGIPGWVVQTGEPVLLEDVREEDERYHACDTDTRSELCVPLRVGERTIGALNLESRRLAAFSEDDLRLLSIMAGHLAAVIENARLFEEVEERQVYLEGVLGAAPDAIVTLDVRQRIVEWNSGAERLFGYSRAEAIGQNIDSLVIKPDVLNESARLNHTLVSGGEIAPVETVRYRKHGSPVDVLLAASPILVGGEVTGAVAVYTDITQRKRAEEALQHRVEFERLITSLSSHFINLMPDGVDRGIDLALQTIGEFAHVGRSYIFLFSEDGTRMDNTHEWCAEGIAPKIDNLQELPVQAFPWWMDQLSRFENIHIPRVADLPNEASVEKEALQAQDIQSLIAVPVAYGRSLLGFLGFASVLAEKTWSEEIIALLRMVGEVIANALAHRRIDEALQESEEKYRNLVERASDGITIMQDMILKYANVRLAEMWGGTVEEIVGTPFTNYIHADELPKIHDRYQQRVAGEDAGQVYETVLRRKDGGKVYVELSAGNIPYQGEPADLVIIRDITDRKQAEKELQQSLDGLRRALGGTVNALASAVEVRDPYTAGHQRRVADLARVIATEMGLSKDQIDGIHMAGMIHDIGKICIPGEILSKPGQLSEHEWGIIKDHSQVGYDILKEIDFPWPVAQMVLQHHERMNGSGYPQGLSDGEILLEARILAVADVVEAMSSHRPYRPARGTNEALEEISQNRGVLYDPQAVAACLNVFARNGFTGE